MPCWVIGLHKAQWSCRKKNLCAGASVLSVCSTISLQPEESPCGIGGNWNPRDKFLHPPGEDGSDPWLGPAGCAQSCQAFLPWAGSSTIFFHLCFSGMGSWGFIHLNHVQSLLLASLLLPWHRDWRMHWKKRSSNHHGFGCLMLQGWAEHRVGIPRSFSSWEEAHNP